MWYGSLYPECLGRRVCGGPFAWYFRDEARWCIINGLILFIGLFSSSNVFWRWAGARYHHCCGMDTLGVLPPAWIYLLYRRATNVRSVHGMRGVLGLSFRTSGSESPFPHLWLKAQNPKLKTQNLLPERLREYVLGGLAFCFSLKVQNNSMSQGRDRGSPDIIGSNVITSVK